MSKWQAIATGELSVKLKEKLAEIAAVLRSTNGPADNPGLMGGMTGIALFFAHYSRFSGDEADADRCFELFSQVFDLVNSGYDLHSFAIGLAGIGWAFRHVVYSGFLEADADELLAEIDPHLEQMMIADMKNGEYDFLHGALGAGVYFLHRRRRDLFSACLDRLLEELEARAETENGEWKWPVTIDSDSGQRGYDLSLSHGSASIISFLASLRGYGIASDNTARLMEHAAAYLLNQARDPAVGPPCFPSVIGAANGQTHFDNPLAWCRGDLGIAASLLRGARSVANRKWEEKAIAVLLASTKWKAGKGQGPDSAQICHGTAGAAHIYNRIYQATGIDTFRESACDWLEQTLALAVFPDGYAGFKSFHSRTQGWVPSYGFLEGIAGIGLALLASVSPDPPLWDQALLLS